MISDAASTERPSSVTGSLFIGGALAARSAYTLQHFGITHILCLCSNEIGQSDSQYPDIFEYKNFSVSASFSLLCFHLGPAHLKITSGCGVKSKDLESVDMEVQSKRCENKITLP